MLVNILFLESTLHCYCLKFNINKLDLSNVAVYFYLYLFFVTRNKSVRFHFDQNCLFDFETNIIKGNV